MPISSTGQPSANQCKACNFSNPAGSRFCQNCGNQLLQSSDGSPTSPLGSPQPPQAKPASSWEQLRPTAGSTDYINQGQPFRVPISRPQVKGAVYEDFIQPAENPLVSTKDQKLIFSLTIALTLATGFKFMLLFDAFPPLFTWLMSGVLMGSFVLIYFFWMRSNFRSKGFAIDFELSRFDILATTVLSTFFISYLGVNIVENKEASTIQESKVILVNSFDQKKFKTPELSVVEYFYRVVHPKVKRDFLFLTLGLGFASYFLSGFLVAELLVSFNLLSNFMALFIMVEIFPGIGRDKFVMKSISSWQSLLLFLGSFLLFVFTMGIDVIRSLDVIF